MSTSPEQAQRLASGNYGRASLEQISFYGVPFFIVDRGKIPAGNPNAGRHLLTNGTAFVIDLGQGPFAVTADHVVGRALQPTVVRCGLFPKCFQRPARSLVELDDLEKRIISRDAKKDIATLRVSQREVETLEISTLTSPPMVPEAGKGGIAFVGYPGAQRYIDAVGHGPAGLELTLSWEVFPGFGVASSVSERQITYQLNRSELTPAPPGFRHPDPNLNLGGMSGGPMLTKCQRTYGIEFWAPAGVITQGEMRADLNGGLLFASRLDGLQADGTISPM